MFLFNVFMIVINILNDTYVDIMKHDLIHKENTEGWETFCN